MLIYIARHAWAGEFGDPRWPDDSLRELTPEGAERYAAVVSALAGRDFAPHRIAASPLVRCQQTAQIIARYTSHLPDIDTLDALAPGADIQTLLEWSCAQQGRDVCWCGHNPDMPHLLAELIDGSAPNLRFAKGAIAAVRFQGEPAAGCGELLWHVTAKILGC